MKKDMLRGVAGLLIVLTLYILTAFLIPFEHTAVFWVSFIFTLVAFVVVAVSIYIAFGKNPDAKSKFYGFPIARIGVIYGLAQLTAGIIFMALASYVPVWVVVLICSIALGVTIIGLIGADAVAEEIHEMDVKLKKDVSLMRALQSKVHQLTVQCDEAALKALAEELRYSDPVSADALAEIERDLAAIVDVLQSAVIDGDTAAVQQLCRRASAILAERNRLCKLNKN